METEDSEVKNIGLIKVIQNFISKLKASFENTPLKPKKIFITAEKDAETQSPDNQIILSTRNL
jgi:hypothetical protein